jgi:beta-galactosidase
MPGGHISRRRTGALLGVGNGDSSCQESDKQPQRSLFNGLAQVILQSSKTPGMIIVEAYTEDSPGPTLPLTRLSITTRKVPLRPAAS